MTVDEMLRRACIYAEEDRTEFLDCIAHCKDMEETIAQTKEFIKKVRAYRMKRWGKTKLESIVDGADEVDVFSLASHNP